MKTLWVPKIILNIPALHNYLLHRQEDRSPSGYSFSLVLLYISLPLCVSLFCSVLILTCPPEGLPRHSAGWSGGRSDQIQFNRQNDLPCMHRRLALLRCELSLSDQSLSAFQWLAFCYHSKSGPAGLCVNCRPVWSVCLWCSTICRYSWRFSEGTWLNECRRSIHKTSWRLSPLNREGVLVTHKLWVRIWNF